MALAREVIVEPIVQDFLHSEIKKFHRLQNIFDALCWRLAREPEAGAVVPHLIDPPRFLIRSKAYRFPLPQALVLLYHYSDTAVTIEMARIDEQA